MKHIIAAKASKEEEMANSVKKEEKLGLQKFVNRENNYNYGDPAVAVHLTG